MIAWREDYEALVAEAAADSPIDPRRTKGDNVVLLLLSMLNISGTLEWGNGWVAPVLDAFHQAGVEPPSKPSLCWYRLRLSQEPELFADVEGVDPCLLGDLMDRALVN